MVFVSICAQLGDPQREWELMDLLQLLHISPAMYKIDAQDFADHHHLGSIELGVLS